MLRGADCFRNVPSSLFPESRQARAQQFENVNRGIAPTNLSFVCGTNNGQSVLEAICERNLRAASADFADNPEETSVRKRRKVCFSRALLVWMTADAPRHDLFFRSKPLGYDCFGCRISGDFGRGTNAPRQQ